MLALFFGAVVPVKAAIISGGLLLLTRRVKSRRVYAEVDWSLLLMFAGLFIIVAPHRRRSSPRHHCRCGPASSRSASCANRRYGGLSNLVGNVPVRVDAEAVCRCAERSRHGLAGRRDGVDTGRQLYRAGLDRQFDRGAEGVSGMTIGFWDYFRVGAPLTIITLMIGTLWLRSM